MRGKTPVRVTAPRFELMSQRQKVSRLLYQLNHRRGDRLNISNILIKDSVAIAIRSLKDRCVTIVSLTLVLI